MRTNPKKQFLSNTAKSLIRLAGNTLALLVTLTMSAQVLGSATELPGRVVAIWSKGAGKFVRSAGVEGGVPRADRDSYDAGKEGRFLCFSEAGGTFAFMDVMLERYLTHGGGQLTSAVSGIAASRRFTLEDQGNHYYAIRADNGNYVRVNGTGNLVVDAVSITNDAVFAIVPIRNGPNVIMRAYCGDDPYKQLPTIPNEAAQFCLNPADYPVNKVNIGLLQMTPILYSDQQFIAIRKVWNTNRYEDEFILPYTRNLTLDQQMAGLINNIRRIESLGYTFEYVILYHEILANLPAGPWSDARVSSQEEIDLFRTRVMEAFNRGEIDHPYYKAFAMPYQFTPGGGLIQPGGCNAACLAFIKDNFDGMFLEVNGHDYITDNGAPDAALAAVWCRDNGLEFGITSGHATGKDTNYKTMYQAIFSEMAKVGFDKSWDKMHYILHHVYQPYENRLPEWVANTTTENSRWLIENVKPYEAPSISPVMDTDADGITDLQEALNGTYPLGPGDPESAPLSFDDFSTYTPSPTSINGQYGVTGPSLVGFASSGTGKQWTSSTPVAVIGGVFTQGAGQFRSSRAFGTTPLSASGTVFVRARLALSNAAAGVNFSALELTTSVGSDSNSIRLSGNSSGLNINVSGTGGVNSAIIGPASNAMHVWLLELNLTTKAGKVWLDPNLDGFDPGAGAFTFTAPSAFALNGINIATFGASSSVALDELRIGQTWDSIGVTVGAASPTITLAGTLSAVNTTYGSASATPTSFTVTGSNLTPANGNLTVAALSGYEYSTTSGGTYTSTLNLPYTGAVLASTTVYVRLTASATVAGSPYAGNISVSGGGASAQTIASVASAVGKANSVVTTWPTASSIAYGQTLVSSSFSGGVVTPAGGTYAFTSPLDRPGVGTASHAVTYTPAAGYIDNYNPVSGSVSVTVTPNFASWIDFYTFIPVADRDPGADPDKDGLTNAEEYAFGLIPNSSTSCDPITVKLDQTTGTFSYTRTATPATTGITYTVWTSTSLAASDPPGGWTQDTGATEGTVMTAGTVQTVPVTLSGTKPLAGSALFVRVKAVVPAE